MAVTTTYGAAPTYVKIASNTLSTASSSLIFSNVPQGYTDLVVVVNITATQSAIIGGVRFNGDGGNNYSSTRMVGGGSSATSTRYSTDDVLRTSIAITDMVNIINIFNYSNTTTNKTVISRSSAGSNNVTAWVGTWRSTSAITEVNVTNLNYPAGTTYTLYGIKAAFVPKATGGDTIATDGTYWYHTFKTSGTFTPSVALTCDYLVVAGGGAGGNGKAGGGGAGGLRSTVTATGGGGSLESALSLASGTGCTVTIGAGGVGSIWQISGVATTRNGNNSVFATITATAGGGGGQDPDNAGQVGASGGSGGGAARRSPGGTGTANQGYAGGTGFTGGGAYGGGGGGGAGAVGANGGNPAGGNGGIGVAISAFATPTGTGVSNYYAGGGGACAYLPASGVPGTGGSGGGGNGASTVTSNGGNGTANTGGGGGGADGNGYSSGNGGSGLVIVRYPV